MSFFDDTIGLLAGPRGPRVVFAGMAAACVALVAFALYLQHYQAQDPCPLCILQRVAFLLMAVFAAAAAALPTGRAVVAFRAFGALVVLSALAGTGVAVRHVWLQLHPQQFLSCGGSLDVLLETFPLAEALPKIFRGTGDCAEIGWTFLGWSIPQWTLLCFVVLTVIAVWATVRRRA